MIGNSVLNKARYSKNTDEWYTDYRVIEEELSHYTEQFYNNVVLCNCDNPYKSNFTKYFIKNFNILKLKKLICTSYNENKNCDNKEENPISKNDEALVFEMENYNMKFEGVLDDNTVQSILQNKENVKKLDGNGDFRSKECIEYLKEADVVVTNPPFSKFIDLFLLLVKYKKKYLLIGNQNAITYKEIFPYIKNGEAKIGYRFGEMAFKVPENTEPRKTRYWVDDCGEKWRSLGNAMWLTNLNTFKNSQKLKLKAKYTPEVYPKYDNFDAINISRVSEIPFDFFGIMGVPVTYLKYHDEEQFEIIGEANHGSDNDFDLFKPTINGKEIFKRILIKRIVR